MIPVMPISWGGSPVIQDKISGHDIVQFTKFFRGVGLDFSMTYTAGLWEVCAWSDAGDHQTYSSGHHHTVEDALIACYTAVRRQSR